MLTVPPVFGSCVYSNPLEPQTFQKGRSIRVQHLMNCNAVFAVKLHSGVWWPAVLSWNARPTTTPSVHLICVLPLWHALFHCWYVEGTFRQQSCFFKDMGHATKTSTAHSCQRNNCRRHSSNKAAKEILLLPSKSHTKEVGRYKIMSVCIPSLVWASDSPHRPPSKIARPINHVEGANSRHVGAIQIDWQFSCKPCCGLATCSDNASIW